MLLAIGHDIFLTHFHSFVLVVDVFESLIATHLSKPVVGVSAPASLDDNGSYGDVLERRDLLSWSDSRDELFIVDEPLTVLIREAELLTN